MNEIILKLQKNIFQISVVAGIFLGFSLAYLFQIILILILEPGIAESMAMRKKNSVPSRPKTTVYKSIDEIRNLVSGNFLRDSSVRSRGMVMEDMSGGGQIMLFGVISGHPSIETAAIQVVGENEVNEYRPGKTVAGFKLVAIHYNGITVERGGSRIKIGIGEQSGAAAVSQSGGGAPSIPGAQKITIKRDRIIALSQDQTAIYKNKFAPITQNGKIAGFKMIYIPEENNFLYEMGARSGDIIRRFNGQPLENSEKMFEMWQNIKTADKVSIELERGGKIIPFEIEIQN